MKRQTNGEPLRTRHTANALRAQLLEGLRLNLFGGTIQEICAHLNSQKHSAEE